MKYLLLLIVGLSFTACLEGESKHHPAFEPTTIQTDKQKKKLHKLAIKARANHEANLKNTAH